MTDWGGGYIPTMLNLDVWCFKNMVASDKLASEMPADQGLLCL